jgi:lysophospholipase L1-like esterase
LPVVGACNLLGPERLEIKSFMKKHSTVFAVLFTSICALFATSLSAQSTAAAKNRTYLALGDSLAYGFNPNVPYNLAQSIGYPKLVAPALNMGLTNASCPGETSGTLAGTPGSVFLPGFDCVSKQNDGELFVRYGGAPNQLAYAVGFLLANKNTKLITINIGVNDLGILIAQCTAATPTDPAAIAVCEQAGLPGVLGTYGQNLNMIFATIRSAGYGGNIIALNAYAFNYNDPTQVGAITALNQVLAQVSAPFGVAVADGYRAFQIASTPFGGDPCKAGLLIRQASGACDTHPTLIGQGLLATAVVSRAIALPQ